MSALTAFAKGKPCLIRIDGFCTFRDEETVPCHVPLMDHHGTALKMPDLFVAFGCMACHDIVDGRDKKGLDRVGREKARLYLLEGMIRTQHYLMRHAPHLLTRFIE